MKIIDLLKKEPSGVSFEFFPYRTPKGREQFLDTIHALKEFKPLYMSMTYGAGGTSQERTIEAVDVLLGETNTIVMPHLTCVGSSFAAIKSILEKYRAKGVENIMALRGDAPKGVAGFDASNGEFVYARELVAFIKNYGNFSCAGAVYPEGHIESASLDDDLENTKRKIDAGVDFAVTQMFFDNQFYYRFRERYQKKGISIPVIPGIFPVTDLNKLRRFIEGICRTTIPKELDEAMSPYLDDPEKMQRVGIEYTIKQCRDLKKNGVKFLHFFTFNNKEIITQVLKGLV